MLRPIRHRRVAAAPSVEPGPFAIVASRYNERFVGAMVRAAEDTLGHVGSTRVDVIRVPGAFEIPVVTARLARCTRPRYAAIVCLGVILRGETTHAQFIGEAVTEALARLQIETECPIIHEVLLLENIEQARRRCLDPKHNRGIEAAQTALEMAALMGSLAGSPRRRAG
jgi:6,7-dimethyl-8-ribityllumazine synthase